MVNIKITDDKDYLARFWTQEYAEAHAGKTFGAEIQKDGWAIIEHVWQDYNGEQRGAKFHPDAFTIILDLVCPICNNSTDEIQGMPEGTPDEPLPCSHCMEDRPKEYQMWLHSDGVTA